ncbi:hypothetical protein CTheo_4226 [Ceratobasidium theobromae]|uniref:Uncharacterized protein n=1 Tax=Ceratobasidium theobromae TaxID=1582974 RepID=A0A5N5QKR8_9AGAM|nr:hypothetical protein CTheo_4226 [Ceratobasidium theobromae]
MRDAIFIDLPDASPFPPVSNSATSSHGANVANGWRVAPHGQDYERSLYSSYSEDDSDDCISDDFSESSKEEAPKMKISFVGGIMTAQPVPAKPVIKRRPCPSSSSSSSSSCSASEFGSEFLESPCGCLPEDYQQQSSHRRYHSDPPRPFWDPPLALPPPALHTHDTRHSYNPQSHSADRPVFADISGLPNPLGNCGTLYPVLLAPPVSLLRDLQTQEASEKPSNSEAPQPPAELSDFGEAFEFITANDAKSFLLKLSSKASPLTFLNQIFNTLINIVQLRFAERVEDQIISRVQLVPRGALALCTIFAAHPTLDFDLVLPADFVLRRWNISRNEIEPLQPRTIAQVLDLDPASIIHGEIDATRLRSVFQAVWEQLNGGADGFIFPGGREESERYLPRNWCSLYKDYLTQSNRLRLVTRGANNDPVYINLYIKVALTLYGQEMVVGVDQSSAISAGRYQMVKRMGPGIALGETPLSPVDRTALLSLIWWKKSLSSNATERAPKIQSSHFILALAALQLVDSEEELHVARAESKAEGFSLSEVLETMLKILQYLDRAYNSPLTLTAAPVPAPRDQPVGPAMQYPFPLSLCTTMDALFSQASVKPGGLARVTPAITAMIERIQSVANSISTETGKLSSSPAASKTELADPAADETDKVVEEKKSVALGPSTSEPSAPSPQSNTDANTVAPKGAGAAVKPPGKKVTIPPPQVNSVSATGKRAPVSQKTIDRK